MLSGKTSSEEEKKRRLVINPKQVLIFSLNSVFQSASVSSSEIYFFESFLTNERVCNMEFDRIVCFMKKQSLLYTHELGNLELTNNNSLKAKLSDAST